MTGGTDRMWLAVDALTLPTTRRLHRDTADEVDAAQHTVRRVERSRPGPFLRPVPVGPLTEGQAHAERVQERATAVWEQRLRSALLTYHSVTSRLGRVPSLWDQAEAALTTGSEQQEGRSKTPHRTPCDLELMEVRADIADSVEFNIVNREPGRLPAGDVKQQLRHLASLVSANPDHVELWTYKFEQWARVLAVKLQAVLSQPKPRALRGTVCPECRADHAIIEAATGERLRVPPLVIDFQGGLVRAAECLACHAAWFRGDLGDLADLIAGQETA